MFSHIVRSSLLKSLYFVLIFVIYIQRIYTDEQIESVAEVSSRNGVSNAAFFHAKPIMPENVRIIKRKLNSLTDGTWHGLKSGSEVDIDQSGNVNSRAKDDDGIRGNVNYATKIGSNLENTDQQVQGVFNSSEEIRHHIKHAKDAGSDHVDSVERTRSAVSNILTTSKNDTSQPEDVHNQVKHGDKQEKDTADQETDVAEHTKDAGSEHVDRVGHAKSTVSNVLASSKNGTIQSEDIDDEIKHGGEQDKGTVDQQTNVPKPAEGSDSESVDLAEHERTTVADVSASSKNEASEFDTIIAEGGGNEAKSTAASGAITPEEENQPTPDLEDISSIHVMTGKPDVNTFYVLDSNHKVCLIVRFQAIFKLFHGNKVITAIPKNATAKGECWYYVSVIEISWSEYTFGMHFERTGGYSQFGNCNWYVAYMWLEENGSNSKAVSTSLQGEVQEIGKITCDWSYSCPYGQITLYDNKDVSEKFVVMLKHIRLQPFFVKSGYFSKARRCEGVTEESPEDETVPLAVGLTLAILTLIAVLGFSVHRAYTMRKVDYNSME